MPFVGSEMLCFRQHLSKPMGVYRMKGCFRTKQSDDNDISDFAAMSLCLCMWPQLSCSKLITIQ